MQMAPIQYRRANYFQSNAEHSIQSDIASWQLADAKNTTRLHVYVWQQNEFCSGQNGYGAKLYTFVLIEFVVVVVIFGDIFSLAQSKPKLSIRRTKLLTYHSSQSLPLFHAKFSIFYKVIFGTISKVLFIYIHYGSVVYVEGIFNRCSHF